jgi:hypothetical protein
MSEKQPLLDGQKVQTAPAERIKVETEDFINAVKGDRYNCAMVWAIRRKYPDARRVMADVKTVAFSRGEQRFVYPATDDIVENVIKPLDTGGEVKPCIVRLSDGYVKPVNHRSEDALERQNKSVRTRVAQRKQEGMKDPYRPYPTSSGYRRLTVLIKDGDM